MKMNFRPVQRKRKYCDTDDATERKHGVLPGVAEEEASDRSYKGR